MNPVAVSSPAVAASDVICTLLMSAAPTVSEIAPPCVSAPSAANTPIRKAARIVEMASAPIAGANGGELLFAPTAHAVARLVSVATRISPQKPTPVTTTTHH
jgi:hypothetical protein